MPALSTPLKRGWQATYREHEVLAGGDNSRQAASRAARRKRISSLAIPGRPGGDTRVSGLKICDSDDQAWRVFLESRPEATVFHHPAWSALMANAYGYRPFVVVQVDDVGQIEAGLPLLEVRSPLTGHRFVSVPFADHCTPLARDAGSLQRLTSNLVTWRLRAGQPRIEVRGPLPAGPGVHPVNQFVRHIVPLEADPERVFQRFDPSRVRKAIRRAGREGLQVRISASLEDLGTFYPLFCDTRRRLGVPVQPRRYLRGLWTTLIQKGLGFLVLAYKDAKPVAGWVFLAWNGTLIAKYGCSLPAYWSLRPNNLVYWAAIEWGCQQGFRQFDLGRTEINDRGLRFFKEGWGASVEPLAYTYLAESAPKPGLGLATRGLGTVIRHSPTIVCRALGEVLYGHFG